MPDWNTVFKSLKKWRENYLAESTTEDTAVTALVDEYGETLSKPSA